MNARTIVAAIAMCVATAMAAGDTADHRQSAPSPAYLQALRVTDLFLDAWLNRDADTGLALMSSAILLGGPRGRDHVSAELRQYMTGLSNPHHEAFEISRGSGIGPDRFAFPVRLLELYTGETTGVAISDTLEVVRQGDEWRVDRLPRRDNPD